MNFANSPNLAASQSFNNRSRANWVADNYNFDPDYEKPPTNYHLKSKRSHFDDFRWISYASQSK